MSNRILALDPAEKFGWSVSNRIFGCWNFAIKRDQSFGIKLIKFKSKLHATVKAHKIDLIVFERVSGHHSAAIMSHSKFIAVIEIYCLENNIPYQGYSAPAIKKDATGKGNCGKPEMIKAAQDRLGYQGTDDNEADALWLLNLANKEFNK